MTVSNVHQICKTSKPAISMLKKRLFSVHFNQTNIATYFVYYSIWDGLINSNL